MPNDIEIVDVQLTSRRAPLDPTSVREEPQRWVDIVITLLNRSPDTTYHVIAELRRVQYDPVSRTLDVALREPEAVPGEMWSALRKAPQTVAILPGATHILQISLPQRLTLLRSSGLGFREEVLDLGEVERVACQVAYDPTPFYPRTQQSGDEMRQELARWGTSTGRTFDRRLAPDVEATDPADRQQYS